MTHKYLYILPALALLFGFTACSSEDITDGGQKTEVTGDDVIVKAGIGANSVFTRSNPIGTKEEQAQFNSGDMIMIFDESGNNCYYSYDGKVWTIDNSFVTEPKTPLKWDKDVKSFHASYPMNEAIYRSSSENNYNMGDRYGSNLSLDQSNINNLTRSDIMYADTTVSEKPTNHTLALNFKRMTARVILKFTLNEQFDGLNPSIGDGDVKVNGVSGYYKPSNGSDNRNNFTPYHDTTNDQYIVLVFPQEKNDAQKFLDVTVNTNNGVQTPLTLTGTPALEKGKSYTFNVLVGKEKMSIESVTVNDWNDPISLGEGEATDTPAKIASVNLAEVKGYSGLTSWLDDNIGNKTGYTAVMKGEWKAGYNEAIASFTHEYKNADLTLDLSGVTNLTSIVNYAFNISNSGLDGASVGLTGIILPTTVETIGKGAFQYTGLKSINLPEGITSIGASAFQGTNITTLTVPSSLTTVGDNAFESMDNLTEIRFKGEVTSLGMRVFGSDNNLKTIYLDKCDAVPTVTEGNFGLNDGQSITVYVKNEAMVDKFATDSNWGNRGFTFKSVE